MIAAFLAIFGSTLAKLGGLALLALAGFGAWKTNSAVQRHAGAAKAREEQELMDAQVKHTAQDRLGAISGFDRARKLDLLRKQGEAAARQRARGM